MLWIIQVVVVLVCFFLAVDLVRQTQVLTPRTKFALTALATLIVILLLLWLAGLTGSPPTWLRR